MCSSRNYSIQTNYVIKLKQSFIALFWPGEPSCQRGQRGSGQCPCSPAPAALTWHVAGSFGRYPGNRQLILGVALVKLPLEDGEQAGDPVVQTHVEDELQEAAERKEAL